MKLEPISWELNTPNPLFIVCVGVWVGHSRHSCQFFEKNAYTKKLFRFVIPEFNPTISWVKFEKHNLCHLAWFFIGLLMWSTSVFTSYSPRLGFSCVPGLMFPWINSPRWNQPFFILYQIQSFGTSGGKADSKYYSWSSSRFFRS